MRLRFRVLIGVILLTAIALVSRVPAAAVDDRPRLLLISIDGLMPSTYTTTGPAKIPTLRQLMAAGVHADGVTGIMPSVTYPSHTTLVTGVVPAVHGIYDNRIVDPEGLSRGAWYWYASDIKVPTLPLAARARGLRTGAIYWPVTVGLDLDYVFPEFWRSDHPEGLKLLKVLSSPRDLLDGAELAQGQPFAWPFTDRERTAVAKFVLRTYQPHVLLVHLLELDGAGHDFGPDSAEWRQTLERMDGYVREILDTLSVSGLATSTTVAVVSDHGFLPTTQEVQPNTAFKEAGLLTLGENARIASWQAYFHSSGGSGFVYLRDRADAQLRDRVHGILRTLQANPANGIRRVWTRPELDRMGAHPDAAFGLDVVDGFYTGNGTDRLVIPADGKGGHGFDPARPALRSSFIAAGPAVAKRGSLGTIRMTQIAPTLARVLGVGLSPRADQPFTLGRTDGPENR